MRKRSSVFFNSVLALALQFGALEALQAEEGVLAFKPYEASQEQKVGDALTLELDPSRLPEGFSLSGAQLVPPASGSFQDQGWEITLENGLIHAAPLRAGALKLPSLIVRDAQSAAQAKTPELEFQIRSTLDSADPQSSQPAPVRPPWSSRFPWIPALAIFLAALALLVGLITLLVRFFRRKKPVVHAPSVVAPPQPEDEVALAALHVLEKSYENGSTPHWHKPAYFGVSEILKNYLAARFNVDALESTSGEILILLSQLPNAPSSEEKAFLKELFQTLDRVKFTDERPELDAFKPLIERAREWILKTRRRSAPSIEPILPRSPSHAP